MSLQYYTLSPLEELTVVPVLPNLRRWLKTCRPSMRGCRPGFLTYIQRFGMKNMCYLKQQDTAGYLLVGTQRIPRIDVKKDMEKDSAHRPGRPLQSGQRRDHAGTHTPGKACSLFRWERCRGVQHASDPLFSLNGEEGGLRRSCFKTRRR